MINSIGQWIQNLALGFTLGENLFIGGFPDKRPDGTKTPVRVTTIIDQTSSAVYFDRPDRVDLVVQVLSRGSDKREAYNDANTIFRRIHGLSAIDLPEEEHVSGHEFVAMTIEANQAPQYVGQDSEARLQYSTNYIFRMRDG